jgi:hypothetical protein
MYHRDIRRRRHLAATAATAPTMRFSRRFTGWLRNDSHIWIFDMLPTSYHTTSALDCHPSCIVLAGKRPAVPT